MTTDGDWPPSKQWLDEAREFGEITEEQYEAMSVQVHLRPRTLEGRVDWLLQQTALLTGTVNNLGRLVEELRDDVKVLKARLAAVERATPLERPAKPKRSGRPVSGVVVPPSAETLERLRQNFPPPEPPSTI